MVGCHCWMPLLGAMVGCHGSVPLLGAVPPFSAAPFSTLITHKLVCAIWGLCRYNFMVLWLSKFKVYNYLHIYNIYIYI